MILKVVYHNPNPNGANVWLCEDAIEYQTKNRELWIWREGAKPNEDRPDIVFSVGQWICAERQLEEEQNQGPAEARSSNAHGQSGHARAGTVNRRRMATTDDLTYPSPEFAEERRQALIEFAVGNLKVPWSDAHMAGVLEYEEAIRQEHGDEAVKELPWNKVPRASDGRPPINRRR